MRVEVVFAVGASNELAKMHAEGSAADVADALSTRRGYVLLQYDNEQVWVNPANVLYVREVGEPSDEMSGESS